MEFALMARHDCDGVSVTKLGLEREGDARKPHRGLLLQCALRRPIRARRSFSLDAIAIAIAQSASSYPIDVWTFGRRLTQFAHAPLSMEAIHA